MFSMISAFSFSADNISDKSVFEGFKGRTINEIKQRFGDPDHGDQKGIIMNAEITYNGLYLDPIQDLFYDVTFSYNQEGIITSYTIGSYGNDYNQRGWFSTILRGKNFYWTLGVIIVFFSVLGFFQRR